MNIGTSLVPDGRTGRHQCMADHRCCAYQGAADQDRFQPYGNTGGSVLDTAGNVYHEEASGATFWGPSGGATGHSLQINVDKTSDTEYTLTSSPKGSARSDGVPAATATKTVTVPADKMEALFASGRPRW